MRASWLTLLLLGTAFAGCLAADDDHTPTLPPPPPYSRFVCADGSVRSGLFDDADHCNVRITGNAPRNNAPANELTIAVDPKNPLRLVAGAKDYTLGESTDCGKYRVWSGYYWSEDGGFTWGNQLMPGHDKPVTDTSSAINGYKCNTDPVAYFDNNGHAFYSGLAYNTQRVDPDEPPGTPVNVGGGIGSNLWIARSDDGGKTYAPADLVAQANDDFGAIHDKQWFTIDLGNNNLYVTWSAFPSAPVRGIPPNPTDPYLGTPQILFSRSTDGGQTWTPPRVLYESDNANGATLPGDVINDPDKQFSMPQVDADGTIHVTWKAEKSVWHVMSGNQGVSWTPARVAVANLDTPCPPGVQCPLKNSNFRVDTSPVLAIDRSAGANKGALYVVYAANTTQPEENMNVYLVKSVDRGMTWTQPVQVNPDADASDQFLPWVDVGPRGDVHIVYYDRHYARGNRLLDLSYVHSLDGVAFDPPLRVTEASSDASLSYHQTGREFIGDYLQVVEGNDGRVHPIWVDTRGGRADAYTTVILR